MNTSEPILVGVRLWLARLAWWCVFLASGTFAAFYYINQFLNPETLDSEGFFLLTLNNVVSLIAILFAVFLFAKKSNNWMVILVSMMLITRMGSDDGYTFWLVNLHGWEPVVDSNLMDILTILYVLDRVEVFRVVGDLIFLTAFLTFPNGKWIFPRVWLIPVAWLLFLAVEPKLIQLDFINYAPAEYLKYLFFFALTGFLQLLQYWRMGNSIQRQQIKWIIIFLVVSLSARLINLVSMSLFLFRRFDQILADGSLMSDPVLDNLMHSTAYLNPVISLGLMAAFSISIFRYRLWDTDVVINRALIYGTLTGLLSMLGVVSVAVVDYLIKRFVGKDESSIWAVLVSALPVAAAFNPLRDRLKSVIDRYFKPEEVNFTDTFIEFSPAVLKSLSTDHILDVITTQAAKQLNVDTAMIYLIDAEGRLYDSRVRGRSRKLAAPVIDKKQMVKLKAGKPAAVDGEGATYSMLVPLYVRRARIPDLIGVLALGTRLEGTGYSTQILKSLEVLGREAGQAIYLSQMVEPTRVKSKIKTV